MLGVYLKCGMWFWSNVEGGLRIWNGYTKDLSFTLFLSGVTKTQFNHWTNTRVVRPTHNPNSRLITHNPKKGGSTSIREYDRTPRFRQHPTFTRLFSFLSGGPPQNNPDFSKNWNCFFRRDPLLLGFSSANHLTRKSPRGGGCLSNKTDHRKHPHMTVSIESAMGWLWWVDSLKL